VNGDLFMFYREFGETRTDSWEGDGDYFYYLMG
jgi:hypothetical protein